MVEFELREMSPNDAEQAVALLRLGTPNHLHPYMTLTQRGGARYLSDSIRWAKEMGKQFLGAFDGKRMAGFAEYSANATSSSHLSQIFVSPHARRRGVAASLIGHRLRDSDSKFSMELDVFADNRPALSLYEKIGFRPVGERVWWTGSISESCHWDGSLRLFDLPQAVAVHKKYGFSYISGCSGDTPFKAGRIGRHVLKVMSAADLVNRDILSSLHAAFPEMTKWLYVQDCQSHAPDGEILARSFRMRL